jgi:hypothetical protein
LIHADLLLLGQFLHLLQEQVRHFCFQNAHCARNIAKNSLGSKTWMPR